MPSDIRFQSSNIENIDAGELRAKYSAAGDRILRYYIDFRHTVLDLHKELSAPEINVLQSKVHALMASWDKKYDAFTTKKAVQTGKESAEQLVLEAETRRNGLRQILNFTLSIDDAVDWEYLKDKTRYKPEPFPEPRPGQIEQPIAPIVPKIRFVDRLLLKGKKIQSDYNLRRTTYEEAIQKVEAENEKRLANWKSQKNQWDVSQVKKKKAFLEQQTAANAMVEELKQDWIKGIPEAILEHASIVLDASEYDEIIQKSYTLEYRSKTKTLLIDYLLPSPSHLPLTKSVRFVASTGELRETQIAAKEKKSLYDDMCYQICLRTIHEIFEACVAGHISTIVFNGFADYIDKSNGKEVRSTFLSLMVDREEFLSINLAQIDPKTCFKSLKGVSASSLIGMTPIAPVMALEKDDKRFVEARNIDLENDGSTNLAAIGWEEFEQLVREIFNKEFSLRGGEVKVTQSSRDGGVDAVAFDPDPISGGKIIIQAKRYTKTVGVAAVRDLFGTTVNEGANKGILVTTADFGPDAYKFASDKPITLLNGANLLHLLAKHGIDAKIDLRAARETLGLSR